MASVFIRYRFPDYAAWKQIFDERESVRREYGITGHSVHRDASDPNVIIIALRASSLPRAQEYAQSDSLRDAMTRAGVEGTPEIWFADDVEEKSY